MRQLRIFLILFIGLLLGILVSTKYETEQVQALGPACPVEISAYFELEESAAPFADSLGGPLATCTDCPSMVTGKIGMGQQFDGEDDQVSVTDQGQYDWGVSDEFSIEYWMNSTSVCPGNQVHVGRQGVTHPKPHWWVGCYEKEEEGQPSTYKAAFNLIDQDGNNGGTSDFAIGTTDITDGGWHHIVAVKDATHIRIYVDGTEDAAVAKTYTAGFDSTTNLNIGFINYPSQKYHYQGTLDEIATYDKALTPAEILLHYNAGVAGDEHCFVTPTITSAAVTTASLGASYSYNVEATGVPKPTFSLTDSPGDMNIESPTGLITWTPTSLDDANVTVTAANERTPDASQTYTINVSSNACSNGLAAYWKLDESSSGSYADFLGGHTGSCAGACPAPTSPGRINDAQVFIGSSTGIDIPADPVFDWGANDSFSIEYWAKRPGQCPLEPTYADNAVALGRDDAASQLHWWTGVSCINGGKALFTLRDSDTDNSDDALAFSNTVITGGAWHHIAAVRDGDSEQLRLYVDGRLEDTVEEATFSSGFGSATAAVNMGRLNLSPYYNFEGTLDEVAIYNRVLSQTEIKSHYHLGRGYCEACTSDIKIMPLANSIGYGNSSGAGDEPEDSPYYIAWRKDLWETLKAGGYFVDFIGANEAGEFYESEGFDPDNAAYPGAKPRQIFNLLNTGDPPDTQNPLNGSNGPYLNAYPPDVILLHIGTNGIDLTDGVAVNLLNTEKILDEIDEYETAQNKTIPVVLALIINESPDANSNTSAFNDLLAAEVWKRVNDPTDPAYPDNIILINMEDGTESAGGDPFNYDRSDSQPAGDMWDKLHPFETGYAKMANTWFNGDSLGSDGLVDFLPVCGDSQLIQLNAGWNFISSYIAPADTDLDVVLAGIIDDMVLMKNGAGEVYWPSDTNHVDDIHDWNPIDAYQIYMTNDTDLAILGTKIDPESMPIDLVTGWNHIAYLRDSAHPVADSLSSISDELYLVKNGYGEVYWPYYSSDQIGNMLPGQGYQVYMKVDGQQLIYPANSAAAANVSLLSRERRSKP